MVMSPQEKKILDYRSTGMSLREIAEKLNISRKKVESVLGLKESTPAVPTSEKKAAEKKEESTSKGK